MKRYPTIQWCGALAVLVALFHWKLFFPSQFTLLDGAEAVRQAYSWFHFWIRSVRAGSLPVWDPYAQCGYNFPGETQTAAFYPLYLLLLLFPTDQNGMLTSMQYNLIILSARILAALFMFALARELKLSRFAAFVSGFCFSVSSFTGKAYWPNFLESAIWLPLIFLFLLRALHASNKQRILPYSLLSGVCLGLSFLAGGTHIAMEQGITIVTALTFYAFQSHQPREAGDWMSRPWLRAGVTAALILGAGFCAAAVQLLPSQLHAAHTIRFEGSISLPSTQKIPYRNVTESALSPAGFLTVLFPFFEGMGQGEVWTPYIGVFPFALAVIAIVRCWSHLWVRYLSVLSIAAMLYALAGSSALHGVLYAVTPWLWMICEAPRFIYLTGFGLAVLVGFGVDLLCARLDGSFSVTLRRVLFWVSLSCFLALCLPALFPKSGSYWTSFSLLMILASCGLLRFALVSKSSLSTQWRLIAIALIFFDLNAWNWSPADKIEADRTGHNDLQVLASLRNPVKFLKAKPELFRVRCFRDPQPNIGDAYGIQDTAGIGATIEKNFLRIWLDFDLLNVRYFIKPASVNDPAPIYQDADWKVYENLKAFSRSWLVHHIKLEPDDETLFGDLHSGRVDLHQTALLNAPLPHGIEAGPQEPNETVSFRSYVPSEIKAAVHTNGPALLVFSEIYYPGWYATVNGKEATIYRADGAFRSVLVPPGNSMVELRYRPWSVYIGAVLSCATILATLVALIPAWRERNALPYPSTALTVNKDSAVL